MNCTNATRWSLVRGDGDGQPEKTLLFVWILAGLVGPALAATLAFFASRLFHTGSLFVKARRGGGGGGGGGGGDDDGHGVGGANEPLDRAAVVPVAVDESDSDARDDEAAPRVRHVEEPRFRLMASIAILLPAGSGVAVTFVFLLLNAALADWSGAHDDGLRIVSRARVGLRMAAAGVVAVAAGLRLLRGTRAVARPGGGVRMLEEGAEVAARAKARGTTTVTVALTAAAREDDAAAAAAGDGDGVAAARSALADDAYDPAEAFSPPVPLPVIFALAALVTSLCTALLALPAAWPGWQSNPVVMATVAAVVPGAAHAAADALTRGEMHLVIAARACVAAAALFAVVGNGRDIFELVSTLSAYFCFAWLLAPYTTDRLFLLAASRARRPAEDEGELSAIDAGDMSEVIEALAGGVGDVAGSVAVVFFLVAAAWSEALVSPSRYAPPTAPAGARPEVFASLHWCEPAPLVYLPFLVGCWYALPVLPFMRRSRRKGAPPLDTYAYCVYGRYRYLLRERVWVGETAGEGDALVPRHLRRFDAWGGATTQYNFCVLTTAAGCALVAVGVVSLAGWAAHDAPDAGVLLLDVVWGAGAAAAVLAACALAFRLRPLRVWCCSEGGTVRTDGTIEYDTVVVDDAADGEGGAGPAPAPATSAGATGSPGTAADDANAGASATAAGRAPGPGAVEQ